MSPLLKMDSASQEISQEEGWNPKYSRIPTNRNFPDGQSLEPIQARNTLHSNNAVSYTEWIVTNFLYHDSDSCRLPHPAAHKHCIPPCAPARQRERGYRKDENL
jgi:hypothetical protein